MIRTSLSSRSILGVDRAELVQILIIIIAEFYASAVDWLQFVGVEDGEYHSLNNIIEGNNDELNCSGISNLAYAPAAFAMSRIQRSIESSVTKRSLP